MASRMRSLLAGGLIALFTGYAVPALANSEVEKRAANPDTWGAPGRDNKLTRHSPLNDINSRQRLRNFRWHGRSRPARCAATKASLW